MGIAGAILGVVIGVAIIAAGFYLIGTNAVEAYQSIIGESAEGTIWAIVWVVIGLILLGVGIYAAIFLGAILGALTN